MIGLPKEQGIPGAFPHPEIITTGSAGGLFCPYKGLLPASISRCTE
jgi:hypothetical protein